MKYKTHCCGNVMEHWCAGVKLIKGVKDFRDRFPKFIRPDIGPCVKAVRAIGAPIEIVYVCRTCKREEKMVLNKHWTDSWRIGAYVLMEWMLKERRARDLTSE